MIQLAKGLVEEVEEKGHANVLKLTSTLDGEKLMYLALPDAHVYSKWYRKCKKVRSSRLQQVVPQVQEGEMFMCSCHNATWPVVQEVGVIMCRCHHATRLVVLEHHDSVWAVGCNGASKKFSRLEVAFLSNFKLLLM